MRGTVPNAVGVPLGEISVRRSPRPSAMRYAMREPIAIWSSLSRATEPAWRWPAIASRAARSSGRMPRTRAPEATPWAVTMTCPVTSGVTVTTSSAARRRSASWSKSAMPCGPARSVMWPLRPSTRPSSSARKPLITASTTISVPTPSAMPSSEKVAITEMKPSSRRGRR